MIIKQAKIDIVSQFDDKAETSNDETEQQFKLLVQRLKKVAPKSEDFLYFVARSITAMEAANFDENGNLVGDGYIGTDGAWHSESGIEAYLNQNGDAFPERELLAYLPDLKKYAYQTFIGRGLFVNHKSEDAEQLRGIILDASWVPEGKYVDLLVAVDQKSYPELARQITAGYSNSVSMGTQVQFSICSICGHRSTTEEDFCDHIRYKKGQLVDGKKAYEINNGLSFIELSVVSTGADRQARIKQILAELHDKDKGNRLEKLQTRVQQLRGSERVDLIKTAGGPDSMKLNLEERRKKRQSYFQGNTDVKDPEVTNDPNAAGRPGEITYPAMNPQDTKKPVRETEQKKSEQEEKETAKKIQQTPSEKERLQRADAQSRRTAEMDKKKLEDRASKRRAYFQGNTDVKDKAITNDPNVAGRPGEMSYPAMNPQDTKKPTREIEQKKFEQEATATAKTITQDPSIKEKLQRARLRARFTPNTDDRKLSTWSIFAGDEPILEVTADQIFGEQLDEVADTEKPEDGSNWDWVASKEYGLEVIKAIREQGFEKVAALLRGPMTKEAQESVEINIEEEPEAEELEELLEEEPIEEDIEPISAQIEADIAEQLDTIEMAAGAIRGLLDVTESGEEEPIDEELAGAADELGEFEDEFANLAQATAAATAAKDIKGLKVIAQALDEAKSDLDQLVIEVINPKVAEEETTASEEAETKEAEVTPEEAETKEASEEVVETTAKVEEEVTEASKEEKVLKARQARRKKMVEGGDGGKKYDVSPFQMKDLVNQAHAEKKKEIAPATGDGGVVENIYEEHEKVLDVATKTPKGEITAKDKTPKKAEGAAGDPAAASYYKEMWKDIGPEGAEFAQGLVKDYETSAKKSSATIKETRLKVKRAYEVAIDMQDKGLLAPGRDALNAQVDELMKFDDQGFTAFQKAIANVKASAKTATAGKTVRPGIIDREVGGIDDQLKNLPWT